jgi:hypothetical protein
MTLDIGWFGSGAGLVMAAWIVGMMVNAVFTSIGSVR